METRTYTVNVPARFPDLDSEKAARMLETALAQGVELAPDAVGSGPKALRLTVNEGEAEALREMAGGASMAAAFRRLFSTVAGVRSRPRLESRPARILDVPARAESQALLPAKVRARQEAPARSLAVPPWFDPANPNRGGYWRSLGGDVQQRMIEAHRPERTTASRAGAEARPKLWPPLILSLAFVVLFFALPILARFLSMRGASVPGGSAPSGPRFPEWRPQ